MCVLVLVCVSVSVNVSVCVCFVCVCVCARARACQTVFTKAASMRETEGEVGGGGEQNNRNVDDC